PGRGSTPPCAELARRATPCPLPRRRACRRRCGADRRSRRECRAGTVRTHRPPGRVRAPTWWRTATRPGGRASARRCATSFEQPLGHVNVDALVGLDPYDEG